MTPDWVEGILPVIVYERMLEEYAARVGALLAAAAAAAAAHDLGRTVVCATHDPLLTAQADVVVAR